MTRLARTAAERLRRLCDTLESLRERVRAAVASELGRVVGDAVRDLVTAAAHPQALPQHSTEPRYQTHDRWADDGDDWRPRSWDGREQDSWDEDESSDDGTVGPAASAEVPPATPVWATALSAGTSAARWVTSLRGPRWLAASIGLGLAAATLIGGPSWRAAADAAVIASDLATHGTSTPD